MAKAKEEYLQVNYGEAVPSKLNTTTKVSTVMEGLLNLSKYACTQDMIDLLNSLRLAKKDLDKEANIVKIKFETELTDKLMADMKQSYRSFSGAVLVGLGNGDPEQIQAATDLDANLTKSTKVFKNKSTFISELKKALEILQSLDQGIFKLLGIPKLIASIQSKIENYELTFQDSINKQVDNTGAVKAEVAKVKRIYADIVRCFEYQQNNKQGAETKLVEQFNQFCVNYSAAQKISQNRRKSNDK